MPAYGYEFNLRDFNSISHAQACIFLYKSNRLEEFVYHSRGTHDLRILLILPTSVWFLSQVLIGSRL